MIERVWKWIMRSHDGACGFSEIEHRVLGWSTALATLILALGLYFATT